MSLEMDNLQLIKLVNLSYAIDEVVCVLGAPGCGKSTVITEPFKDRFDIPPIFRLASIDPVLIGGLPWFYDYDLGAAPLAGDEVLEKRAKLMPLDSFRPFLEAQRPTILVFDEFTQGHQKAQGIVQHMILERDLNGIPLSKNVRIVLAGNQAGQGAASDNGLLETIKGRVVLAEMGYDSDSFASWVANGAKNEPAPALTALTKEDIETSKVPSPSIVAWLRWMDKDQGNKVFDFKADVRKTDQSCTSRNLVRAGRFIQTWPKAFGGEEVPLNVIAGCIGSAMAPSLLEFIRIEKELPRYEDVLADPGNIAVPERTDIQYCLLGFLANSFKDLSEFDRLVKFVLRCPGDAAFVFTQESEFRWRSKIGVTKVRNNPLVQTNGYRELVQVVKGSLV